MKGQTILKDTAGSLQNLWSFRYKKPNQMANRTLNFEAGNGNWWGPCKHENKLKSVNFMLRFLPTNSDGPYPIALDSMLLLMMHSILMLCWYHVKTIWEIRELSVIIVMMGLALTSIWTSDTMTLKALLYEVHSWTLFWLQRVWYRLCSA